ncbi:hypothetical protein RDI58_028153 [Solanum bulbocastanum]|uniref:Uncharacterized protein n=1 Tax=Solanum bulbocastanum TaxID=147425 RepID=A0AAN8XYF0_SOLBU
MEEKTNKSHILVLPIPGQGHINPMVQFSKRLASKGVKKVTLVTIYSISKNMPKEYGLINIESIPHDDESPPQNIDKMLECAMYYHMDPETTKISFDGSYVSLPRLPLLAKEDLPSFIYDTDLYPALRGLIFSQNINFNKADWLFFNTFNALEKEVLDTQSKLSDQLFHQCILTRD